MNTLNGIALREYLKVNLAVTQTLLEAGSTENALGFLELMLTHLSGYATDALAPDALQLSSLHAVSKACRHLRSGEPQESLRLLSEYAATL